MNTPLVSVIIPSYNSKHTLGETIQSVLDQTYEPLEIIVVDDGSQDGTETLMSQFSSKKVQFYRKENSGASSARNYGISKSTGQFIQFLDSDDLLHPDKIEKQLKHILDTGADVCFSPWTNFLSSDSLGGQFRFNSLDYQPTRSGKEMLFSFGMDNWFIPVFSWLINRELIQKSGDWNEELTNNDDGEYFTRILLEAKKVVCIDEILGYYRVSENDSLSMLNSKAKIKSSLKSYELIERHIRNAGEWELLCYPKRLYFTFYQLVKDNYPKYALIGARRFDRLKVDFYLKRKNAYWVSINLFGLVLGSKIYKIFYPFYSRVVNAVK